MLRFILFFLILTPLLSHSQYTGATPWKNCFGINASCKTYPKDGYFVGCSEIKVTTSSSSPVIAIVKRYGKVLKHAIFLPVVVIHLKYQMENIKFFSIMEENGTVEKK